MNDRIKVLLDNGHGSTRPGKEARMGNCVNMIGTERPRM